MKRVGKSIGVLRGQYLIYRDSDFIAINKPLGLSTTAGKEASRYIRDLLKSMELFSKSNECPVPVNSMKESISGVQLLSINSSAGRLARSMIKNGQFWTCKYLGIVSGRPPIRNASGVINIPLKNGEPDPLGNTAITHWRRLKSTDEVSLIEFEPRTDVEDQISLHCGFCLKTPLLSSVGLHLHSVNACLPGAGHVVICAPVRNELKDKMHTLGWT